MLWILSTRGNISLQSCITTSLSFAKATKAGTIALSTLISLSFSISFTSFPDLNSWHHALTAPVNVFSLAFFTSFCTLFKSLLVIRFYPYPWDLYRYLVHRFVNIVISHCKYNTCFIIKQILCNKNSTIIYNKTNQM